MLAHGRLLRLERGRALLHDTDLQVQLIADRVGYRNAGDFTRASGAISALRPGSIGVAA
jgi:transcriptional regulator GlxA family with amidase domain